MELWGKRETTPEDRLGKTTGVALEDVAPLLLPRQDPAYPALTPELLRLSAEMCNSTYDMEPERWIAAGWIDVSIQVDGDVSTGIGDGEKGVLGRLADGLRVRFAQHRIEGKNLLGNLTGSVRQIG